MKESKNSSFEVDNRLQLLSIFLLLVVAVPSFRNGWHFMNDASGVSAGFSPEMLGEGPFQTYFIPGILLFFFFGILNTLAAVFVFLEVANHPWAVFGQGFLLLLWLGGEVLFGYSVDDLQVPFFVIGFFLMLLGVLLLFRLRRLEQHKND